MMSELDFRESSERRNPSRHRSVLTRAFAAFAAEIGASVPDGFAAETIEQINKTTGVLNAAKRP